MMFITGDCHADWKKFNTNCFPEQKTLTRNDYVLVTGDFGIWDNSEQEKWWLDWMNKKNFTILFVDGNHENFDILNNLPVSKWKEGNVHFIRDNVIHLMRGEIYNIDSYKFFTFGGARSHDIEDGILDIADPDFDIKKKKLDKNNKFRYRIKNKTWWQEELPNENEFNNGINNLLKNENKVDFIISHCCPSSVMKHLDRYTDDYTTDILTDYFDKIYNDNEFKIWFFGHHHENKKINNKFICLYEQIVKLY